MKRLFFIVVLLTLFVSDSFGALVLSTRYPGRTASPSSAYPQGAAQNITSPGDGTGFPWEKDHINDRYGFFQRLLLEASITPSGNPDTVLASDYYDALDVILSVIDDKYLPNNVEKLLLNDTSVTPGDAQIGQGYQGRQFYGNSATGLQSYGQGATAEQRYGFGASGDLNFGYNSTGAIEIGSTAGSNTDKKLISLTKEATFEAIIDGVTDGAWQTPTPLNGWSIGSPSLRYKFIDGGKRIMIVGAASGSSATDPTVFLLPAAYRPTLSAGSIYAPAAGELNSTNGPVFVSIDNSGNVALRLQSNVNTAPSGLCYINQTFDLDMP